MAKELNQNYDLGIETGKDEEDLTFLGEAVTVVSFIRDNSQVIGKYRYKKIASYVQEICAFCMYLPCECQHEVFDAQLSLTPPPAPQPTPFSPAPRSPVKRGKFDNWSLHYSLTLLTVGTNQPSI